MTTENDSNGTLNHPPPGGACSQCGAKYPALMRKGWWKVTDTATGEQSRVCPACFYHGWPRCHFCNDNVEEMLTKVEDSAGELFLCPSCYDERGPDDAAIPRAKS